MSYTVADARGRGRLHGRVPGLRRDAPLRRARSAPSRSRSRWRLMPPGTGGRGSYGHRHPGQEEVYFVVSGHADVQGRRRRLRGRPADRGADDRRRLLLGPQRHRRRRRAGDHLDPARRQPRTEQQDRTSGRRAPAERTSDRAPRRRGARDLERHLDFAAAPLRRPGGRPVALARATSAARGPGRRCGRSIVRDGAAARRRRLRLLVVARPRRRRAGRPRRPAPRPRSRASRWSRSAGRSRPARWGEGLAPEAARAALAWGFDRRGSTRSSRSRCVENRASQRVMQKLGMGYVRDFERRASRTCCTRRGGRLASVPPDAQRRATPHPTSRSPTRTARR